MVTHLHTRSAYTLLNSTLTIDDIVRCAKKEGCTQIALTDKHVMHGAMAFYHACIKEHIKPIFGLEVDVKDDDRQFSFLLYAKNDSGYKQLLKISSRICTSDNDFTIKELSMYVKDLIVATSGSNDDMQGYLLNEDENALKEYLIMCQKYFSDFYVAIAMNDSGLLNIKNKKLEMICEELGIECFALSRIYYENREDEEAFRILCAIDQQKTEDDPSLQVSAKRYFRSDKEMHQLYSDKLLNCCEKISSQCQVKMQYEKVKLPKFFNRFGVDSKTYLRNLCRKGLEKRCEGNVPDAYVKRLSYELDVILNMGYADYFLIVYDFIRYAKSQGIYVGPGRGSAAGSLVSYCLGITHIDPIKYDLLFERFLNPERISMPDIDVDFPDNRRDEVISYVKDLYGEHHVAHIITFGTLGAKQVMRDVGRALNIPVREVDMLCKMIPFALKMTLQYAYDNVGRFKQTIMASKKYMHLFEMAKKLEGLPRHASTHAAGIVLSDRNIEEVCPLIQVEENVYSTQFTMEYLEELGLIKMDFLALRNLTIIDDVCRHVSEYSNSSLDIMKIPLDDAKTYELIRAVDTIGIFQLESDGMKNLIRQMQPRNFEDIAAAIALFRPGPMENIPLYLKHKSNASQIEYLHEDLKDILKNTYGIMIYQEQVMQVAQKIAGFSLGKADILRKAISKKKETEMKSLQKEFIAGAIHNGYDQKLAEELYDQIMKFAGYGFNRSHSIAYGLVAYQLAYLKANYPLSFFTSLLNSVIGSETKTSEYIFEARKRHIEIVHPSINKSESCYMVEGNVLRFPLLNIKNVGVAAVKEILEERAYRGVFKDYFDFVARISTRRISRKVIESLIDAGALDEFKIGRMCMKASLDDALRYASLVSVETESQIMIDLDLVSKPVLTIVKEDVLRISENEKNVLGFYLSRHPISDMRMRYPNVFSLIQLHGKRGYVQLVCFVERIKEHRTKNGDLMAFISVSDETSKLDLVCMPNIYQNVQSFLRKGCYLYVEGKIDDRESCLIRKMEEIKSEA